MYPEVMAVLAFFMFVFAYLVFDSLDYTVAISTLIPNILSQSTGYESYDRYKGNTNKEYINDHDPRFSLVCDYTDPSNTQTFCNKFWMSEVAGGHGKENAVFEVNKFEHISQRSRHGWITAFSQDVIQNGELAKWEFKINNYESVKQSAKDKGIRFGLFCTDIAFEAKAVTIYSNNNAVYYRDINNGNINNKKAWYLLGHDSKKAWLKHYSPPSSGQTSSRRQRRKRRRASADASKSTSGILDNVKYNSNSGDIVTVVLDLIEFKVDFYVNYKEFEGFGFNDIYSQCENGYRLSIESHWHQDSLSILKYWKQTELNVKPRFNIISEQLNELIFNSNQILSTVTKMNNNELTTDFELLMQISSNIDIFVTEYNAVLETLEKYNQTVNEIKTNVDQLFIPPNEQRYTEWSLNDIIKWIYSLDNGQYRKYIPILAKNMETSQVKANDLPYINRQDLHISFGISKFRDRIDLEKHFQRLPTIAAQSNRNEL